MNSENQFGRRPSKRRQIAPKPAEESGPGASIGPEPQKESPVSENPGAEATTAPPARTESPERRSRPISERPARPERKKRPPRGREDRPPKYEPSRSRQGRSRDERSAPAKRSGFVKLSVVIPAFNEEGNIEPLFEQFEQLFKSLPYRAEMIFIDDGSTDKTPVKAKDSQSRYPWLKIYTHRANRGIAAAFETGFAKATGRIICFYPADLQYQASDIPRMVSKIDTGTDIVTGWKAGKYGGLKAFRSFVYNLFSRLLFRVKVHDLNSIKAFRREVIESFVYREGWHRYVVVMAAQAGFAVDEVKVKLLPRRSGKSKIKLLDSFWAFLDLLSVKFQLSFTKKPLLFFGTAGLASMVLGLATGAIAVYLRFVEHAGFRPLLYMVILLVVSGLLLFTIGFLAELIVGIRDDLERGKHQSSKG